MKVAPPAILPWPWYSGSETSEPDSATEPVVNAGLNMSASSRAPLEFAPARVEIENLPAAARRKLPRYPVPVLRVARLAVDESARGMGLGSQLLRFALHLALQMAEDYGCAGVVVDAKPDAVSFYARYGFISMEALEGQSESRPEPVPMFLSMRAIRSSPGRRRPE